MIADLFAASPYTLGGKAKAEKMLAGLNDLTQHHYSCCDGYHRILDGIWDGRREAEHVKDVPFLPVSLFKTQYLKSIADTDVRLTLTSSGTTGQAVSRIAVNSETSTIQQRALAHSLSHMLGKKRLPMLVIDTSEVFKNPQLMSARGAGVLGIMRYGHHHAFALNADMEPDFKAVRQFLAEYGDEPFFMFGFTFMVWVNFYEKFKDAGLNLENAVLIHSGGWKKMVEQAVDNAKFRASMAKSFRLTRIFNFYGMVEQLGSLFVEGPEGLLYPPNYSDVIIRCPNSWEPLPNGEEGIIQVLSLIPRSYPGHSLLTEDWGVIEAEDPGTDGYMGKGLRIIGRVAKAELRGCSDVIAAEAK